MSGKRRIVVVVVVVVAVVIVVVCLSLMSLSLFLSSLPPLRALLVESARSSSSQSPCRTKLLRSPSSSVRQSLGGVCYCQKCPFL